MKDNIGHFEELDNNLLTIKKICETIKARYEKRTMPWVMWEEHKLNEENVAAIENYNILLIQTLKELGLEETILENLHSSLTKNFLGCILKYQKFF